MAESNSFSDFDQSINKSSPKTDTSYGTTGSKKAGAGFSSGSGLASEDAIMNDAEHLYEEGLEQVKNVMSYVKENWIMIAGVGAALGLGAFLLRGRLPFSKKAGASRGHAKLPNIVKNVVKTGAKRSGRGSAKSASRAHH